MSMLGSRTRKVTTYGKKRTGIVPLYTDDKLLTPNRNSRDQENATSVSTAFSESPTRPKRAPLTSKPSSDNSNLPAISSVGTGRGKKGSKLANVEDEPVKNKSKPKASTRAVKTTKKKERFDGVELQLGKSQTKSAPRRSTILEITEEISEITITDPEPITNHRADLKRLIESATLPNVQDFTAFLSSPAVLSLLDPDQQKSGLKIRKIGEASYSEVFAVTIKEGNEIVVKVIPLYDPDATPTTPTEPGTRASHPDTSAPGDVLRELEITKRMSELPGGGVIDFLGSYVAKGKYPQALLDEWWSFKTSLGSSSACPGKFGEDQRYALVILSDGGLDLETFKFDSENGWKQAAGVFWQTADALARAEKWTSFEHRDLHEGQILISSTQSASGSDNDTASPINYLSPSTTGARATIIDFGLSRLSLPGSKASTWSAFPPEVYEGKGDQWDVYRSMRDMVSDDWSDFHPRTNVLWLQYLLRYLLHRTKSLRRPKIQTNQRSRRARAPRKSDLVDDGVMAAYTCLVQTEEQLSLGGDEIKSAQDLLAWGKSSEFAI